jgi:hypothetical protein
MYLYRWSRPGASRANLLDASEPFQMQVGSVWLTLCVSVVQLQGHRRCAHDAPGSAADFGCGLCMDAESAQQI